MPEVSGQILLPITKWIFGPGSPRDLRLRVSRAYFNGLRAPKGKTAVLQGSIASHSGFHRLHLSKFEKTTIGIVRAPGLQALKMVGSRALVIPLLGPLGQPKRFIGSLMGKLGYQIWTKLKLMV